MIIKLFIALYFSIFVLGVPTTQQIIPVHNYPIYQQTYRNIPITIPVSILPVNNNPCNEALKVLNPIINQANLAPIISENINKILYNKVLSNPAIQTIFDTKARIFNQYGVEIPKQVTNYDRAPNIVNNYFIVPPECFKIKDNVSGTSIGKNEIKFQTNTRKNLKEVAKDSKSNIKPQITSVKTDTKFKIKDLLSSHIINEDAMQIKRDSAKEKNKSKNKRRNRKNENLIEESNSNLDIFEETHSQTKLDLIDTSNKDKNTKSMKRSNKKKLVTEDEFSLLDDNNGGKMETAEIKNERSNPETKKTKEQKISIQPLKKDIKIKTNDGSKNKKATTVDNNMKLVKNIQHDKLTLDFKRLFPNIPDDVLKNMMYYNTMTQYQRPLSFNYPNNLFPFNFEQMYQYPQIRINANKNKNKRRKPKGRKTAKRRRNNKKSKTVLPINEDITPEFLPMESLETLYDDIIEVTKESVENNEELHKIDYNNQEELPAVDNLNVNNSVEFNNHEVVSINNNSKNEFSAIIMDNVQKQLEREPNLQDKEQELHLSELGNEDMVPTIYENGLIEDYYPIFTDNAAYFPYNEEYYLENVNNRHFYTTDRNTEPDKRSERFANFRPLAVLRDKLYNIVENDAIKKIETVPMFKEEPITIEETDKIEFHPAPALEFPGFVTRKVTKESKKDEDIPKFIEEKSSIFSNFKTPLYDRLIKHHTENKKTIPPKALQNAGVETVYAQSKVVKYGQTELDDAIESTQISLDNDHNLSLVMAKSVDYPESFW